MFGWFFTHPSLRGINVDDQRLTFLRRKVLSKKKFLNKIYSDWYSLIKQNLGNTGSKVIEFGSGAGFIEKHIPEAVKTDVFHQPYLQLIFDGLLMPFQSERLNAIVMVDVFHHLPDVKKFFEGAQRSLATGGRIIMIEPWVTAWSLKVYSWLHFEPIVPDMKNWQFDSIGPLSSSNQALPWIVFQRDRDQFLLNYPQLRIIKIEPMMPFTYIFSGGISSWISTPAFCYSLVKWFESLFNKKMDNWGMFALIVLEKVK
jgi:SAM-dependent methyltransferase